MKSFNVINYNFNTKEFEPYDVMPYLVREYHEQIERYNAAKLELDEAKTEDEIKIAKSNIDYWNVPVTFDEFKQFVKDRAQYQFWSRCEYEIILGPWPYVSAPNESYDKSKENDLDAWKEHWKKHLNSCSKWDVFDQIMMNLDVITKILMECVS